MHHVSVKERLEAITPTDVSARLNPVLFCLFFLSGFCSLLYQVVWLRMAFAHFGVITPVVSVVLSVFMLGLGVGSILGGARARRLSQHLRISAAYLYGGAELMIGLGGVIVPVLFQAGADFLLNAGEASSTYYLFASALVIVVAILPWCVMMGATFPLMMSFMRKINPGNHSSFSFLYLANVMGATAGVAMTALVLVELFGFRASYMIAATINFSIAVVAFVIARFYPFQSAQLAESPTDSQPPMDLQQLAQPRTPLSGRWPEVVLFTTGFTSLAMEVVWTRAFTFVLKTTIYSFAMMLMTYLLATSIGSAIYRRGAQDGQLISVEGVLGALSIFSLLPVVLNDPRVSENAIVTLGSIVPLCLALGYLTPRLIDECSLGNPASAGRFYGVNIAGGFLGPLSAAYVLLPTLGTRAALLILSLPLLLLFIWAIHRVPASLPPRLRIVLLFVALFSLSTFVSRDSEDGLFYQGPREIHRDQVATAIGYGQGMDKRLLVNGIGMTFLTPITKVMAHLPMAVNNKAKSALIICFGMGSTFRSMRSWGIDTTVVELSRSVTESFGFFFPDFQDVIGDPKAHVIIDDGRRYLSRSNRVFDVITLDPPPPIEAAASSLLYSKEFYEVVKRHLAPNGILQQWFPGGDDDIQSAVARSLQQSFPYVAAFKSIEDWGYHFLASRSPMSDITPAEFVGRLPESAKRDLMEWNSDIPIKKMAENILSRRTDFGNLVAPTGNKVITDDFPYNEYFLLRRNGFVN